MNIIIIKNIYIDRFIYIYLLTYLPIMRICFLFVSIVKYSLFMCTQAVFILDVISESDSIFIITITIHQNTRYVENRFATKWNRINTVNARIK